MTKYQISFDLNYWECGDGCCSSYDTDIILNGKEIMTCGFLSDYTKKNAEKLVDYINETKKEQCLIEMSIGLDEDGDLEDYLYIDEILFGKLGDYASVYAKILEELNISYILIQYTYDYDKWKDSGDIVLEIEHSEIWRKINL